MDGLKKEISELDLNVEEIFNEQNAQQLEDDGLDNLNLQYAGAEYEARFADEKKNAPEKKEPITVKKAGFDIYPDAGEAMYEIKDRLKDIYMIVSQDGKDVFTESDELLEALNNPENLGKKYFVFNSKGNLPYCVSAEKNGISLSSEPVSTQNQLGKEYTPKESIRLEDIVSPAYSKAMEEKREDKYKELEKISKNKKEYVRKFQKAEEDYKKSDHYEERVYVAAKLGKRPEDICKKPETPKEPAPEFSTGRRVARALYKVITLGLGETSAYNRYRVEMDTYRKKYATYFKELEDYKKETEMLEKRIGDKQYKLHVDTRRAEELVSDLDMDYEKSKLNADIAEIRSEAKTNDRKELQFLEEYHKRPEVIMEGIADINKKGMITRDNIFAHRWVLKNSLEGKNMQSMDENEMRNLASYVVCTLAEKQATEAYFTNPYFVDGQQINRIMGAINNGSAVDAMEKNPIFRECCRNLYYGDNKPLNPDQFVKDVQAGMEKSLRDSKDPLNRLKEERAILEEKFGEKPLSEEIMQDVAKYNMVTEKIKTLERMKNRGDVFTEEAINSAKNIVNDLHSNIDSTYTKTLQSGSKIEMNVKLRTNVRMYNTVDYKQSLKNAIANEGEKKGKYRLADAAKLVNKEYNKIQKAVKEAENAEKNGPVKK